MPGAAGEPDQRPGAGEVGRGQPDAVVAGGQAGERVRSRSRPWSSVCRRRSRPSSGVGPSTPGDSGLAGVEQAVVVDVVADRVAEGQRWSRGDDAEVEGQVGVVVGVPVVGRLPAGVRVMSPLSMKPPLPRVPTGAPSSLLFMLSSGSVGVLVLLVNPTRAPPVWKFVAASRTW